MVVDVRSDLVEVRKGCAAEATLVAVSVEGYVQTTSETSGCFFDTAAGF